MKSFRILLVIILSVFAGRVFNVNAQTLTNFYAFLGFPNDGALPLAGLMQGSDGNFYGTASQGGANNVGTVFRISPSGGYTNLHSFIRSLDDGVEPEAGLVQGSDGNLYGTTFAGGMTSNGTVFRISPSGSYTNLHSFTGSPDGALPMAGLVLGSDGNLYGTTSQGGTTNFNIFTSTAGYGTVFRISPTGTYTTLYAFAGSPNSGAYPEAGLVLGSDGNFYGTTEYGGNGPCNVGFGVGCGTIFRISTGGTFTNLHSFTGSPNDGSKPLAGLVQGSDGNFYGTTASGGTNNDGMAFRISPTGAYTKLHIFVDSPDGKLPEAGLVQGGDGNFYGTTAIGGTQGSGTIFRISFSGAYTNLYSFSGSPIDGARPMAGLVQGGDGNFYGTTYSGGTTNFNGFTLSYGYGTVFKLTVPLNPPPYPINQITGIQLSDANVVLSIPSIAYETYQLQFSSSMNPTNWVNVPGVSVTNGIGALLTLTNFGGAVGPQGFYRFDITP